MENHARANRSTRAIILLQIHVSNPASTRYIAVRDGLYSVDCETETHPLGVITTRNLALPLIIRA